MKKADIYNFRQLFFLDKYLMGHRGYIAGGCFKNIFNEEKVNDIDMFFRQESDFLQSKSYFEELIKKEPNSWRKSYENKKVWSVY